DLLSKSASYTDNELSKVNNTIKDNKAKSDNADTNLLVGVHRALKGFDIVDKQFSHIDELTTLSSDSDSNLNRSVHVLSNSLIAVQNNADFAEDGSDRKLTNLYSSSRMATELVKLDGFNPELVDFTASPLLDDLYLFGYPKGIIRLD